MWPAIADADDIRGRIRCRRHGYAGSGASGAPLLEIGVLFLLFKNPKDRDIMTNKVATV
jgi:hypothetical protein